MKNFKPALVVMLIALSMSTNLYAWNIPDDITFMGLEKISNDVKKTVFSIQTTNDKGEFIPIGTGFLLKQNNLVVGVTCFHVVKPLLEANKDILAGLNTDKGFERFKGKVVKQSEKNDIALLLFKTTTEETIKLENLVLAEKYLEANPKFAEGRAILIPGYPLGIGATHNENNPVIKFGIVAQCSNQTNFLIDGVANPGNSGSPVFDTKEAKFIGMITSYRNDSINLFNQKQELIATLPYNSGLSSAISSTLIIELLNEFKKEIQPITNQSTGPGSAPIGAPPGQ